MNKKRIILVGKAASGKDYARKMLEEKSYVYAISYTTRPPRIGEVDGKDYFFITDKEFSKMTNQNIWYEYVQFNGWYYGTTKEQFYDTGHLFVMTPKGLSHLSQKDRNESLVIYFDINENTRKERIYLRQGNADTVERRLNADSVDFANFKNYDIIISDENYIFDTLNDEIINHTIFIAHA